eukprot:CAMPEP_0194530616 /NCGR_PEP_ID=MMETSP0253-20130528/67609_1 /TAXON_ID=2966 /ORGANISM="Noctiluca scintillans" /LENGTH=198 /DNA_ID=CAMNT_0039375871 /DNA_START=28 /DNA_END=624 /DNA_ORIENTATION=+
MNRGNRITSTPTTRVNAPPGGASSFSFAHEDVPRSQRSPRCEGTKPGILSWDESAPRQSMQVSRQDHAPVHNILEWDETRRFQKQQDQNQNKYTRQQQSNNILEWNENIPLSPRQFQRPDQPKLPDGRSNILSWEETECKRQSRTPRGMEEVVFGARINGSSNNYANGANQNCGNVLSDRPTTRVEKPPGGFSSIRFG